MQRRAERAYQSRAPTITSRVRLHRMRRHWTCSGSSRVTERPKNQATPRNNRVGVLISEVLGTKIVMRAFNLSLAYPMLHSDEGPIFGELGVSEALWEHSENYLIGKMIRLN